jgi:acetoacetyl-CoA synthetase
MVQDAKANLLGAARPTKGPGKERHRPRVRPSSLDSIALAGSPVSPECHAWFYDNVKEDAGWRPAVAARTSAPVQCHPAAAGGRDAGALFGMAVHVMGEHGEFVVDEVGEMVVTQWRPRCRSPERRTRAHKETPFDSLTWRQGTSTDQRPRRPISPPDATLNRHGIRSARRFTAPSAGCEDAIVNLTCRMASSSCRSAGGRRMLTTRSLRPSTTACVVNTLWHVPDTITKPDIPYTISGKRMEAGHRIPPATPGEAANRDAMANPAALDSSSVRAHSGTTRCGGVN